MMGRLLFIIILGIGTIWAFFALWKLSASQKEVEIDITPVTTSINDGSSIDHGGSDTIERDENVPAETKKMTIKAKSKQDVVFVVQAPKAQWENELFQDACEEASVLMAGSWLDDRKSAYSKEDATQELEKMFAFETEKYGQAYDLSIKDTAQFFRDYYGAQDIHVVYDIGVNDIVRALAEGHLVIVPSNGQKLGNPYFTSPGPERHMLVITGYDQKKREFITNDPGTRRGEDFRYDYDTLIAAVRDYPTGHKEPITGNKKGMIVVEKEE